MDHWRYETFLPRQRLGGTCISWCLQPVDRLDHPDPAYTSCDQATNGSEEEK